MHARQIDEPMPQPGCILLRIKPACAWEMSVDERKH
jgi:hypothetical protein